MSEPDHHPIHDVWWLARAKLKGGATYYGAYPAGFLERARALLGVGLFDPVLHVFGGRVRDYPYYGGFGPNDKTLDMDAALSPDYLVNVNEGLCFQDGEGNPYLWPAVLADPPYTEEDADHYTPGRGVFPNPRTVLASMLQVVRPGGRVGLLHYVAPSPPPKSVMATKFIASVAVMVGFNNRVRVFSVYERKP